MLKLNLPKIHNDVKKEDNKFYIFCIIRKKYVVLTPEEWVRQHMVNFLMNSGYSKNLIFVECGTKYNSFNKRYDILAKNKFGLPKVLVECKSPYCIINEATLNQVFLYNKVIKAPQVIVSNGLRNIRFKEVDGVFQQVRL